MGVSFSQREYQGTVGGKPTITAKLFIFYFLFLKKKFSPEFICEKPMSRNSS